MAKILKPPKVLKAVLSLQNDEEARLRRAEARALDPGLAVLRAWQSQRLARTYADLLDDPAYAPACRFFLSEIYAARDFSQRDAGGEQLFALLRRYLPEEMLRPLAEALALNRLTNELDAKLLQALLSLGAAEEITEAAYAEAYRLCDNYEERVSQIERIGSILREVGFGARLPLVGITLKAARLPASRAGWDELYNFLVSGYQAFRPMKDAGFFVDTIERRERLLLDRIYARHPDPFSGILADDEINA